MFMPCHRHISVPHRVYQTVAENILPIGVHLHYFLLFVASSILLVVSPDQVCRCSKVLVIWFCSYSLET